MPSLETITAWINANLVLALGVSVFLGVVFLTIAITGFVSRERVIKRRALQPFSVGSDEALNDRQALGHENAMSIAKTLSKVTNHFRGGSDLRDIAQNDVL